MEAIPEPVMQRTRTCNSEWRLVSQPRSSRPSRSSHSSVHVVLRGTCPSTPPFAQPLPFSTAIPYLLEVSSYSLTSSLTLSKEEAM